MAIRIANLGTDTRTVELSIDNEVLRVVYRPSGVTPVTEDRLRAMAADQRGGASLVVLLADVLVSWDLLDNDGTPYPITAESLSCLPTLFLARLTDAIKQDVIPKAPSAAGSGAGSQPRAD